MQKLCCVCTRQHPLPVWSHKFVLSSTTHISTNSHPQLLAPPQQQPLQEEELPVEPVVPTALPQETPQATTTRSGRAIRPTVRYQQSLAQRDQGDMVSPVVSLFSLRSSNSTTQTSQ